MFTSPRPSIVASVAAIAGLILFESLLAAPAAAATYNEPAGLFSINVPTGWSVKSLGRGEWNVSNGRGAFVHVVNVPGAGTDARPANQLIDRVRAQWQKSERLDGGPAQLGGQRGFYVTFAGVNPAGTDALLRAVAAPFGSDGFVLLISAPVPDYAKLQGTFKDIERSFTAGDGRSSALPPQRPPAGRNEPPERETSRVVTAHLAGAESASRSFGRALRAVAQAYDAVPVITNAARDSNDTVVQATFRATQHGTQVGGYMVITAFDGDGFVGAISDVPARFAQSYPALSKRLHAELPPATVGDVRPLPARVLPMQRVSTPHGTAQIDLPPDWKIQDEGLYGGLDVAGPQGEGLSLGIHFRVLNPGLPREYQGQLQAPFGSLPAALDAALSVVHSHASRILEVKAMPTTLPRGNANYVLFEAPCIQGRCEGVAYLQTAPVDQTHWLLIYSMVAAPEKRFPAVAPTLIAAWKSWSVNPAVLRGQIDDALGSMGKVRAIIAGAAGSDSGHRIANAWSRTILDQDTMQHEGTGAQVYGDAAVIGSIVKRDPTNWHIVPASQTH